MDREIKFIPIGFVKTDYNEDFKKFNNEKIISELRLNEELTEALEGIEEFSHLFVIFYLHKVKQKKFSFKVHPRGRTDLPLIGLFATRTPSRPNQIGLTLVEIISREKNVIVVRGLDAIDGSPILDIKPFFPYKTEMNLKFPAWMERIRKN